MSTTPFPLPITLDTADRKALRARAHHLDPVILIGEAGLTRAVLDETDRALRAHELIKVRVLGDDRALRQAMSTEICSALGCTAVQSIGKLLVLYRPKPIEDPDARPNAPHVPKKRAATGLGAPAKKRAVRTAGQTARKRTVRATGAQKPAAPAKRPSALRSKGAMAMKAMKTSPTAAATGKRAERPAKTGVGARAAGAKALATEGKRTAIGARARTGARSGSASAATQGPGHLQGRSGPPRAGTRARAKKA